MQKITGTMKESTEYVDIHNIEIDYNGFIEVLGINPFCKSSKEPLPFVRSIFYKIQRDRCVSDTHISKFLKTKGFSVNRTTIIAALKVLESNYKQKETWRKYYDLFFSDLKEKYGKKETVIPKKVHKENRDKLDLLIDSLEGYRREEIYELVNLRIKSWEWKSKDRCTIIEGSSPMQDTW